MPRLRWVKLWTQETLYGTTNRELTLEERAIWFEMLALAGDSPTPGTICASPGVSFTDTQLAQILGAPEDLVRLTVNKLSSPEITKISTNGSGLIEIINWTRYQSEFDRTEYQREYMQARRRRERKTNVSLTPVSLSYVSPDNRSDQNRSDQNRSDQIRGEGEVKNNISNTIEPPIAPLKKGGMPKKGGRRLKRAMTPEERLESEQRTEAKHPGLIKH